MHHQQMNGNVSVFLKTDTRSEHIDVVNAVGGILQDLVYFHAPCALVEKLAHNFLTFVLDSGIPSYSRVQVFMGHTPVYHF
jgi:hypothetical protein